MIKDLKELQSFLKICRKQGVTDITFGGATVRFGDLPAKKAGEPEEPEDPANPDGLTDEQLMFFSAGGELP